MAYDSAIVTFTTKTNKVDLVDAAHINLVQAELVTLETILGVGLKGTAASLAARLNNALDSDGSILSGTAFPSPAVSISQPFFRTDLDTFYIKGSTGWLAQGGSLSDRLFAYEGVVEAGGSQGAENRESTSLNPSAYPTVGYRFLQISNSTYGVIWTTKIKKLSGVSTVTVYARIWVRTAGTTSIKVDIGGQNSEVTGTNNQTTPEWVTFTINISSLTNGQVYDVTASLKTSGADDGYCANIIGFGS